MEREGIEREGKGKTKRKNLFRTFVSMLCIMIARNTYNIGIFDGDGWSSLTGVTEVYLHEEEEECKEQATTYHDITGE